MFVYNLSGKCTTSSTGLVNGGGNAVI